MKTENSGLVKNKLSKIVAICGILTLLIILVMLSSSCSDDEVDPKHPCDTVDVTYAGVIQPLLEQKCFRCHGNGNTRGDVDLSTFEAVKVVALNGRLSGAINGDPGFTPMPYQSAKLDSCSIFFVDKWIEEGALNN